MYKNIYFSKRCSSIVLEIYFKCKTWSCHILCIFLYRAPWKYWISNGFLKKIKQITSIENNRFEKYIILLLKAQTYLDEVLTYDKLQKEKNKKSYKDIKKIIKFCKSIKNKSPTSFNWNDIITFAKINVCFFSSLQRLLWDNISVRKNFKKTHWI